MPLARLAFRGGNQPSRVHGGAYYDQLAFDAEASVAFGPTKRLSLVGNTNP